MKIASCLLSLLCVLSLLPNGALGEQNWPRFRGPQGTGISAATGIPIKWSPKQFRWTVPIPGTGQSSPIAWGKRIFLTSATDQGRKRHVHCIDRHTGKILWSRIAWTGDAERVHRMNSWATPTCVTDGERVVACFGNGGLHCYDVEGEHLWSVELGTFDNRNWGFGSSPILAGDLVIQTCDADNRAFLLAVNKHSGKEAWRTPRPKNRSFSTPVLINRQGQQQLVVNGHAGVQAYDPVVGKPLWRFEGGSGRGSPSVVTAGDLVIAVSGRSRGEGDLMAYRLGGSGDITGTHLAWKTRRGGRDLPSPIVVGPYLITVNLRPGLGACYQAATGKLLWKQRLNATFSASPVAAEGRVFALGEGGQVLVIQPGPKYQEVARNLLPGQADETFRASLMPLDGCLYVRSNKRLFCIGSTTAPK